ncbi:hypothetical protein HZA97_02325 [Candidatus Woesearchaeota archaeon]|nr:hypothetical protein [Candidatus Woesearchaeota archaeon]
MTEETRNLLVRAVEGAGVIQRRILDSGDLGLTSKYEGEGSSDIVTVADTESEEFLRDFCKQYFPEFNIFGEEFGGEYNGNGKVILIDPLDGTKSFKNKQPNFGALVGVYVDEKCVAGVEHNTLKGITYVATEETGFQRLGPADTDWPKDVVYVSGEVFRKPGLSEKLRELLEQEFPNNPILVDKQCVNHKSRVCNKDWRTFFHTGLARHDIGPTPLFSRLTNTIFTNHRGEPYGLLNPVEEVKKYQSKEKKQVYSNKVLLARDSEAFEKMLKILREFSEVLN